MSYIGTEPKDIRSFGRTKFDYTATQGQTAFTGADDDGKVLAFTTGQIEVFVNGILMDESDFTTTGTGTVTLASAANLNDVISIVSFETNIPDSNYVPATGGNFTGNVGINKTPTAKLHIDTGTSTNDFDQVLIEGNSVSGSSNPEITLQRNGSSGDDEFLGCINFYGKNDADENIKYAQMVGKRLDASDASEDGGLVVFTEAAGTQRETLFVSGSDSRMRTNNLRIASHVTSGENSAGPTIALTRNDTSVVTGDVLGTIGFSHFDGTPDFPSQTPQQLPASIRAVAAETQGSGDDGANMEFYTKPINENKNVSSTLNMKIANDGIITMPNQPSFSANRDAGHVTGGNVYIFNNTNYNIGSMYDASTGRATAPVDGRYFLGVWLMTQNDATYNNDYYRIRINGANPAYRNVYSSNGGSLHHQFSWSGVLNLTANDYVDIYIDNFTAYGTNGLYSNFSMHLLS